MNKKQAAARRWWLPERKVRVFRMQWLKPGVIATLIVYGVLFLPLYESGVGLTAPFLLMLFAALLVITAAFEIGWCFLIAALFPIRLTNEGVEAYNFWGARRSFPWSETLTAHPSRFFSLRWLRLRAASGRGDEMWLPLDVTDAASLREAARAFAPPDHPLRAALLAENRAPAA